MVLGDGADAGRWAAENFEGRLPLRDGVDAIDGIVRERGLPAIAFLLGFHLTIVVKDSACLLFDPTLDPAATVMEYHQQHPDEVPLLAPELLPRWLARHTGGTPRR